MASAPPPPRRVLTDAERSELTQKLEWDRLMDQLAANKDHLIMFDKWMNPERIHTNIWGPEFTTPCTDGALDDATRHKDEGNKHFKNKKYRWAIDEYTEAAKLLVPDRKLNAVIYCNRATAHKYLGNYSCGLKDAFTSLKFDPLHTKAMIRWCELLIKIEVGRRTLQFSTNFIKKLKNLLEGRETEFASKRKA